MTESTPDGATPEGTTPDTPTPETPPAVTAEDVAKLTTALEKERELRKAAEKTARERENERRASLKDDERALLEAEERGRNAVRSEYGQRLAETEFRAAAATRNPGYDTAKALRYVNLAGFVGEDGEPDTKAITAAVADLIPEVTMPGAPLPPTFDGGPRTTTPSNSTASQFAQALGPLLP